MSVWSNLLHVLGVEPRTPSTAYNFWSGFGSDITELAIIGGVWRMLNCHEQGCWRFGIKITMEDNGRHYRRCTKHNRIRHSAPDQKPVYEVDAPPADTQNL